jgi:DNA-directed RNA polymerase subunit omega
VDHPRIDELLDRAGGSRYALAMIAARRARQINNYYNTLGEGISMSAMGLETEEYMAPLVTTRSKNLLTIALEEIAQGKIGYEREE